MTLDLLIIKYVDAEMEVQGTFLPTMTLCIMESFSSIMIRP